METFALKNQISKKHEEFSMSRLTIATKRIAPSEHREKGTAIKNSLK